MEEGILMELLLWWGCFSFSSLYIVRKCQSLWIHTMRLVQGNTLTIIAAYLYTSHHISKNEPISILIQQFPYNPIQMHIFMVFWLYIVQRIWTFPSRHLIHKMILCSVNQHWPIVVAFVTLWEYLMNSVSNKIDGGKHIYISRVFMTPWRQV